MNEAYGQLAVKSFNNGIDLMKEAKILYEQKHFSRAYVLGILAVEETTKAMACKNVWAGKASSTDLFKTNKRGRKTYYLKNHQFKHYIFHRALVIQEAFRRDKNKLIVSLKDDPTARAAEQSLPKEKADELNAVFTQMENDRLNAIYCNIDDQTNIVHDARTFVSKEKCDRLFQLVDAALPYFRFVVMMDNELYNDAGVLNQQDDATLRKRIDDLRKKDATQSKEK